MLLVRNELCFGCGLCADNCTEQAISLFSGHAVIDQRRCNLCRNCLAFCPQGAIVEVAPISKDELQKTIGSLRKRTDNLIQRVERLIEQKNYSSSK